MLITSKSTVKYLLRVYPLERQSLIHSLDPLLAQRWVHPPTQRRPPAISHLKRRQVLFPPTPSLLR